MRRSCDETAASEERRECEAYGSIPETGALHSGGFPSSAPALLRSYFLHEDFPRLAAGFHRAAGA